MACTVALASCEGPASTQAKSGVKGPLVSAKRVVSLPIGRDRQTIVSVRGAGRVSGRYRRGQAVGVAYRNAAGSSQSAAVQDGGQAASSELAPGERLLRPAPLVGVQLWQVAPISKGRVAVPTHEGLRPHKAQAEGLLRVRAKRCAEPAALARRGRVAAPSCFWAWCAHRAGQWTPTHLEGPERWRPPARSPEASRRSG
jgi:hypothetical protein